MATIEETIDLKIGEVRTESLDVSFGEIISLYQTQELIIQPDFQRLFRWSEAQQSRLIESVLLELPVPQFFVIEREDGVFELIDGLQRVSSIIHFIEPGLMNSTALTLQGCDLIPELNGKQYDDLPLRLRLRLKRSSVRMVVIKRQSSAMLRYEMFKRLNTGGSELSPQEIRNCTARMIGEAGVEFYAFLREAAQSESFRICTDTLAESERAQMGDEELVLRFFAAKNAQALFPNNVREWLDTYMERVILGREVFNFQIERQEFDKIFSYLAGVMGAGAFVRYRDQQPIGGLAPAYYEAVTIGTYRVLSNLTEIPRETVRQRIIDTVQSEHFRQFTGPGANTRPKLEGRIKAIEEALQQLCP